MARTNPRPKLYASAAERQAAYRERFATIEVRLDPTTVETLTRIAQTLDVPRVAVIEQVIKHGLLNRDWFKLGLRSDLKSKVQMQGARVAPKTRAAPKD